ncbi:permease [Thalassospira alkalitolerans]|uniref:permease n=1 Tax=Thalassospira alkalitolerans TaxID=1293890 RepID=UPI0030EB1335
MSDFALQLRRFGLNARKIDRVVVAFVIGCGLVALLDPAQLGTSLTFTAVSLWDTAPFLFLSIGIAAYAGASGADNIISRAFSGHPVKMVFTAAAFGALSPFCSCGVIPLIAALLSMGVPLAPVMAFWLASPVIDPAMFVLTAGTISYEFATFKLIAAIFLGLFGGFATMWLAHLGMLGDPLRDGVGNGGCGGAKMRVPKAPVWAFWHDEERVAKFRKTAISTTLFLGKWLAFAFLLESLMIAYVPADRISDWLGGSGIWPIATATLVGVPAYLNGYAALPLVSGLMDQGMQAGAGMAFLVAGGVSSIPAAIAVFALVKRAVFALYLGYALVGSFLVGLAAQLWLG